MQRIRYHNVTLFSQNFIYIFCFLCVCVSDPLKLAGETQAVVSLLMWVLVSSLTLLCKQYMLLTTEKSLQPHNSTFKPCVS